MANKRIYSLTENLDPTNTEAFVIDKLGNTECECITLGTIKDYIQDGMATDAELALKIDDEDAVHNSGSETIAGTKEFTGSLKVPVLSEVPTAEEGVIYFDSVTKHFVGYNGLEWKQFDN
jgi:hypothetical protein